MPQNRRTPSQLHDAVWLRRQYETKNLDCRKIAKELDCAYSTVARALHRHGIRPRGHTDVVVEQMEKRRQEKRNTPEKQCTRCKEVKSRGEFYESRTDVSGLQTWCRSCQIIGCKEYRKRHPDKIKEQNRKALERYGSEYYRANHQKLKREMVDAYGGKCDCCGEEELEFLSLDHADGGGGDHRREVGGGTRIWRDLRDAGWPKQCEFGRLRVLCLNCQGATKHGRVCPHQLKKEAAGG